MLYFYRITHVKLLTLVSKIEDSPISLAQFFGNEGLKWSYSCDVIEACTVPLVISR